MDVASEERQTWIAIYWFTRVKDHLSVQYVERSSTGKDLWRLTWLFTLRIHFHDCSDTGSIFMIFLIKDSFSWLFTYFPDCSYVSSWLFIYISWLFTYFDGCSHIGFVFMIFHTQDPIFHIPTSVFIKKNYAFTPLQDWFARFICEDNLWTQWQYTLREEMQIYKLWNDVQVMVCVLPVVLVLLF